MTNKNKNFNTDDTLLTESETASVDLNSESLELTEKANKKKKLFSKKNNNSSPIEEAPEKEKSILDIPEKKTSIFSEVFGNIFPSSKEPKPKKVKRVKISSDDVVRYAPDVKKGLTQEQVEERYLHYLNNEVEEKYSKSYGSIICGNVFTFFNLLGLIVTIALIYAKAPLSSFVFDIVYILNIAIGIIQEIRAKLSIEKLSLISTKTTIALRDGKKKELSSNEVVLDDLLIYSIGNQIVTDSVILEGDVEVNESLLTGESVAIKKTVGDKLFAASFITSGTCTAQAVRVGKDNYISQLSAKAKKYKKPKSELMRSLSMLITVIGLLIIPIATFNIFKALISAEITGEALANAIRTTSGLIIGMIPSGMFLLTSMALAVGVIRLARHNTLVQDLYSLEMLARVDVLCLDKTGTITDGRMKVNDCILLNNPPDYTISEIMGSMLHALKDNNQTSTALYNHFGFSKVLSAVKTVPFSSKRKFSAVQFKDEGTYAFGAPEFVLKEVPEKLQNLIRQYASMGLRVLVLANSKSSISGEATLPSMKPIAIITITDCIRENAAATIDWFKNNDVCLKVISGDNPLTVSEISRRVGIPNAEKYISLEGMSERDVIAVAENYTVFGRVSPEQKAILVKQLKIAGHSVAMTGDGVNDILAMKEADCAVALASGSDATRNIAHLVLMDNNFNSMPKVVQEGRRVINNIQGSASLYLMKTLFTMLLAIFTFCIPNLTYPFETSNMLMLEIFIIGIPSFFLSLQANDKRVEGNNFINYVISKSFPSALLMVISCITIIICKSLLIEVAATYFPGVDLDMLYRTMMVYAITFVGVINLYRICQPFNLFRGLLFTICFTAILLCTIFSLIQGSEIFGLIKMWPLKVYWHHMLIVVTIIMLTVPISSLLDRLSGLLRKSKKDR